MKRRICAFFTGVMILSSAIFVLAHSAAAASQNAVLSSGQSLVANTANDTLMTHAAGKSAIGVTVESGDFVVFEREPIANNSDFIETDNWDATNGAFLPGRDRSTLAMQRDGNLVLYASSGAVRWASHTSGAGNILAVQTDGNVVVYNTQGKPLWSSGTGHSLLGNGQQLVGGQHLDYPAQYGQPATRLIMQTDGNLVLYGAGHPLWSTGTFGANFFAVLQPDANFVVYRPGGHAVWANNVHGSARSWMEVASCSFDENGDGSDNYWIPQGARGC